MNGRLRPLLTSLLISVAALLTGSLRAEVDSTLTADLAISSFPGRLEASGEASFLNHYVWRGIRVTDGAVMQPSLSLGLGDFSFNAWGNLDMDDVNGSKGRINEVDYTLDYSFQLKNLGLSLGLIEYTFPNTAVKSTTELYWSISADKIFSPSFSVYKDIDESDGLYLSLGFGHGVALEWISSRLEFYGALGWGSSGNNSFYYGVGKSAATDVSFGVGMPFELFGKMTVSSRVGYLGLLAGNIRKSAGKKDHFTFGLSVSSSYSYPELR